MEVTDAVVLAPQDDQSATAMEVEGPTSNLDAESQLAQLQNLLAASEQEQEQEHLEDQVQQLAVQPKDAQQEVEKVRSNGVAELFAEYNRVLCSLIEAHELNQQLKAKNLALIEELQTRRLRSSGSDSIYLCTL
ncbi:hypothetical protein R1flu_016585 [Riccia fluitans]|uniref:Uncharacterized protein n=1 Tax=Riccia fluitans TaxID=41844 RepID=A0ABD1YQD6_9MARC